MRLHRLIPLVMLVLGLALFLSFDLGRHFDLGTLRQHEHGLRNWVAAHPFGAPLCYLALYVLIVAFSLPIATFVTIVGGFLLGPWLGTAATAVGATAGAGLVFLAARSAFGSGLSDMLRAKAGLRLAWIEADLRGNAFHYLLFLRLVPAFPFWLVNVAPALIGMPVLPYLAATALGILPGTFAFVYFGHSLSKAIDQADGPLLAAVLTPELLIALTILALLALLPVWLKRRNRRTGPRE